ncbi:MAG: exopolysaccharide biosynthesis polyprenyl glycosylphosphotransferase [Nocardioidaceae bacterium]
MSGTSTTKRGDVALPGQTSTFPGLSALRGVVGRDVHVRTDPDTVPAPAKILHRSASSEPPAGNDRSPTRRRGSSATQSDFTRMRMLRRSIDLGIAAAAGVTAYVIGHHQVILIPILWVAMMAIRSTREGRMADLDDLHPFRKTNVNFVLLMTLPLVIISSDADRAVLGISAGIATLGYLNRWVLGRPAVRHRLGIISGESVLVVGSLESVSRTITEWEDLHLFRVMGVCLSEADMGPEEVKGVPVLGSVADIADLSRLTRIDVVAIHDVDKLGGLQLTKLQWALEDVCTQLSIITPMTNTRETRARVRTAGRRLMVDIAYCRPQGLVAGIKSVVDRAVAGLLLLGAVPVMAVCVLFIKLTDHGPALFKQVRVREHGRKFTMYKLRTMVVDAEALLTDLAKDNEVGGGLFKIKHDPRITKVGVWLRRLSLDELPQLWNVVVGDMSLIGPRPALPHEVATYDLAARRRLAVKPGLTGLWQVSGRSNLSWEDSVRIDSDYVDNWRLGREFQIALRTVKAVLGKNGAH